jgi:hypothetical protein
MSSQSVSPSSVPLKKRNKVESDSLNGEKKDQHDEKSAAAALASLSSSPKPVANAQASNKSACSDDTDDDVSDCASYTSLNSVLPKPVHAPPFNSMMVDHTYTDYSVISEESLAFLEEGEDAQTKASDEEKKKNAKRIQKIKNIFGDVGPSKKNSGGVVKPFPEKVRFYFRSCSKPKALIYRSKYPF